MKRNKATVAIFDEINTAAPDTLAALDPATTFGKQKKPGARRGRPVGSKNRPKVRIKIMWCEDKSWAFFSEPADAYAEVAGLRSVGFTDARIVSWS